MEMAKKACGTWESIRIVEEDGCKEKTYYDFGSVKGSIPGGDLKETTYFTECGEVEDGQEYNMQCKSIIEGTWKIEVGDIYFTYDLSTLKVTFEGISFPGADRLSESLAQSFIKNYGQSLIQESIEELKEHLYNWYSENENNEDCYQNVNIKGDNMSFDATDGVIKLIRIK
ncbi:MULTISPECIES: hypothetical protein [Bacteroides]|jgi:hypothetical protein|nr:MULTISPECIES: hypothetical protein [Bacteroides]EFF56363.1 hypothetical protein CW1_1631 [Bacteroides xylanisolvens SD CC 2a]EFG14327.1 hypothetical protein CW3_2548 [Bacteroides xylanisolvens SD CC 1b]CBK68472.1 hypothetical protein BXY_34790 [Bacteroides xylanisolvens XB1A]MDB0694073.1 hypothetical protein [Bacteroides xylanisolvens]CDM00436.1 hypothetical protein BN891_33610 [Bacteroides xylanisolvens SD CC 2a]